MALTRDAPATVADIGPGLIGALIKVGWTLKAPSGNALNDRPVESVGRLSYYERRGGDYILVFHGATDQAPGLDEPSSPPYGVVIVPAEAVLTAFPAA